MSGRAVIAWCRVLCSDEAATQDVGAAGAW